MGDLSNICKLLESNKVTDRTKACEYLSDFLKDENRISNLNGGSFAWSTLLDSLKVCLQKDADRVADSIKKNPTKAIPNPKNGDSFFEVVKATTKHSQSHTLVGEIVGYIVGCLAIDRMKNCYEAIYLTTLKDVILSSSKCRSLLEIDHWKNLHRTIRNLIEKGAALRLEMIYYDCYRLIITWGPLCGLPLYILRNDFPFLTSLCSCQKEQRDTILQTVYQFCMHTAKDYRVSCCKFGEDTMTKLLGLYNSASSDVEFYTLLLDYLLVQVTIHHPDGAPEEDIASNAFNWDTWKKNLRSIYCVLNKDLQDYVGHNSGRAFSSRNSIVTLDSFTNLFVQVTCQLLTMTDSASCLDTSEPQAKRKRTENISIQTFIKAVQESKSWLWIKIMGSMVEFRPKLFNETHFLSLLQLFSRLLVDSKNHNVLMQIFNCLCILFNVQNLFDTTDLIDEIHKQWKIIGESLRAIGLNNDIESSHKLLKQLVRSKIMINVEPIVQNYITGIINLTKFSVQSLEDLLQHITFSDNLQKQTFMACILKVDQTKDFAYLQSPHTAKLLVKLTLRQWPTDKTDSILTEQVNYLTEIKEIYSRTNFEEPIIGRKNKLVITYVNTYNFDANLVNVFNELLDKFVEDCQRQSIDTTLSCALLVVNIVKQFIDYNVNTVDLENSIYMHFLENILQDKELPQRLEKLITKNTRDTSVLLECLGVFNDIFMQKQPFLVGKIRSFINSEVLVSLVKVLNFFQNNTLEERLGLKTNEQKIKPLTISVLSNFGLITASQKVTQHQLEILQIFASADYDFESKSDYETITLFLSCLKNCKVGSLPLEIINAIESLIQGLCEVWYRYYDSVLDILPILNDFYPHIFGGSAETELAVNLLYPFFVKHELYGPKVSILLLKCINKLRELTPEGTSLLWCETEDILSKIPTFLCSSYQEVRFEAINTLINYFKSTSNCKNLSNFHKQEIVFAQIYEKTLKLFEVEGPLIGEGAKDESICRTSAALQTFASLMIACDVWIEECLLALLKLTHHKKLGSTERIVLMLSTKLGFKNTTELMDKYCETIIDKWLGENYKIEDLPFVMFQCADLNEFYLKKTDLILPILIAHNVNLEVLRTQVDLKLKVNKNFTKIFVHALWRSIDNLGMHMLSTNSILKFLTESVGANNLKNVLLERLDDVILCLIKMITDEKYVKDTFDYKIIFINKFLSTEQFYKCLNFIQNFICEGNNLILHLADQTLYKIEQMSLKLQLSIASSSNVDEKLKHFQHLTMFNKLILEVLTTKDTWNVFFLRQTIYSILHLTNDESLQFRLATLYYLEAFFKQLLPKFVETFKNFLSIITNTLYNLMKQSDHLIEPSLKILEFLIVDHTELMSKEIQTLENFPPNYQNLYSTIIRVKTNNQVTLLNQITDFVSVYDSNFGKVRLDTLKQLKSQLANEKTDLAVFYKELQDLRGFSEDCEKSILHQMICRLLRLTTTCDDEINFEAVACLGELGPANLTTLVLEPEKEIVDLECNPFELFAGHLVSLLSNFIVDEDVKVRKATSDALYAVLNSKEGRQVTNSNIDFGHGPINKHYLLPYFLPSFKKTNTPLNTNLTEVSSTIENDNLWTPKDTNLHDRWIINLVTTLLKTFGPNTFLTNLISICNLKVNLCEQLLPLLLHLILNINNKGILKIIHLQIDNFFQQHWLANSSEQTIVLNKRSVQCMLDVVNFLRLQNSFQKNVKVLPVDYLKVAQAAQFCSAHFAALFYAELWSQNYLRELENCEEVNSQSPILDVIFEREDNEVGLRMQIILRNAYKAIGDLDALPGCGVSLQLNPHHRVEHYKQLGQWNQVVQYYDLQLANGTSNKEDLMEALKQSRLYELPILCTENSLESGQYECLWRLGQYSRSDSRTDENSNLEKYKYFALKALHDNDQYSFFEAKKGQALCIVDQLKQISLESSKNLYPILCEIQALNESSDFQRTVNLDSNFNRLLDKWKLQDHVIRGNDFEFIEPILTQRIVLIRDYLKGHSSNEGLKNHLVDNILELAELARTEGHFNVAFRAINTLQNMPDLSEDIRAQIVLQDAQFSWAVNDKSTARRLLSKMCKSDNLKLQSTALKLTGQWLVETYSENRLTIIRNYFLQALDCDNQQENRTSADLQTTFDTYDKLASFADREYQQILTHMKSDMFQRKIMNMQKSKETAASIAKQSKRSKDESKAAAIYLRQSTIDQTEIDNTKSDKDHFLYLALKYYLMNLTYTDTNNNNRIFRIISLFLENRKNEIIQDLLGECLKRIETHKFLKLLPQLIPHISDNDLFSEQIRNIVIKCAVDHPYHTLPLLLSIANANKDNFEATNTINDTRIETVKKILDNLKRKPLLSKLIEQLQLLTEALIELAYKEVPTSGNKTFSISRLLKINRIKNFENILLPTEELPVMKNMEYSNIVGIHSFGTTYEIVGGVNAPKKITCRGTDGIVRTQMVKGHDDLRQDAVMQQVFTIMNELLAANKQTRNLLIRTYKIVPLSMRSGILRWVDNSMPIGEYLAKAHSTYRPNDKSLSSCRTTYKNAANSSNENKLKVFKKICSEIKPVFHKFFETTFPHASIWYERRRAYIHSVATSSMCGYILGIGDRHVSNILIDENTAEVIHIDFGIAFEQGRVLPTPETVPFRLSREIVDGMGISGVEGIFRRSCEKTMEVLRQNAQTIITILEVLLYDPLYVWTVSSAEAKKRQIDEDENDCKTLIKFSDEENNVNISADRALLRLRGKLQGTEERNPTSIEHQVGTLIQQAMDPSNLSKLFHGWQPYL